MNKTTRIKLILVTPIFILLSHYLAVFPHEYAHSFMAWLLGYKTNPFALYYGGTSWSNLLLLAHIDENVNYQMIAFLGHNYHIALIAFSGAGIANGLLFISSLWLLTTKRVRQKPFLYYFLFLFNLMNLGNFYAYVPIRTFASHGDVHNFVTGLHISPWWIYIIFGYIIAVLIWQFFTKTLISAFINLNITTTKLKANLMLVCVCILFGFFGGFPYIYFLGYIADSVTYFLSATSMLAIPGIIVALWPTRNWIKQKLKDD